MRSMQRSTTKEVIEMSYLSSDEYDRQKRSAERRHDQNARVDSLSEEEHSTLRELCRIRHNVHSSKREMYNGEYTSPLFRELYEISRKIKALNLGQIDIPLLDEFPTSLDRDNGIIDDTDEAEEENVELFNNMMEQINDDIERILRQIDKDYGTKYAPTGKQRLR